MTTRVNAPKDDLRNISAEIRGIGIFHTHPPMTVQRRAAFRRRFREIDRERFHLRDTEVPAPPERCNPVEELVHKVLKKCGLDEDVWTRQLMENWAEIVGELIARNARPGRIDRSTLVVYITNSAWLSELSRYGKHQILQNIQRRFGNTKIRSIRLQLDPDLNPIKDVAKVSRKS